MTTARDDASHPRVTYVTAGGAGMFCGSCMRDNTLAATLHRRGVPITLVPTFTPIRTDEQDVSLDRVFLGGINVYLEQKIPWLRHLPHAARRALSHPSLLRLLSKLSLQTRRREDGAIALSLLRGESGHHAGEIADLIEFIDGQLEPDVVTLTNLLISGFVPGLKKKRPVPVVVNLQGDDVFLDGLHDDDRPVVLEEMRRIAGMIDGFIVPNRAYLRFMADLLRVPESRFHIVPLGIAEPEAYHRPEPPGDRPPTVGYLARLCPEKGFHRLVDALLELRGLPGMEQVRLRAGGWLGASDRPFFEAQRTRLRDAGIDLEHVESIPDRDAKVDFLAGLDVFSVPAEFLEPKGLYVLEALAAGVPVVQPDHGAFPELLASTGGGLLVPRNDPAALATELAALLTDGARRAELGEAGRRGVSERHRAETMAETTLQVWRSLA
ncbi:hypothetical protein ABI59_17250 [Acidobacteria bacterium Mor1]|nr:hypothetical protein ABI59_17250 [Acidobacteria bacterium Mor1]